MEEEKLDKNMVGNEEAIKAMIGLPVHLERNQKDVEMEESFFDDHEREVASLLVAKASKRGWNHCEGVKNILSMYLRLVVSIENGML